MVWGRPVATPLTAPDAAPAVTATPAEVLDPAVTPSIAEVTPLAAVITVLAAAAESPIADVAIADAPPASQSPTRRSRRVGQAAPPVAEPVTAPLPDAVQIPAEPFELLEPTVSTAAEPADDESVFGEATDGGSVFGGPTPAAPLTDAESDAFEAAARLFAFTAETPVQSVRAQAEDSTTPAAEPVATASARRNRGASFKRVTTASFSIGVMGIVGLLTVGLTTPADAVAAPNTSDISTSLVAAGGDVKADQDEIQAYVTPSELQSAAIERDETYSTVTMAQLASESGITNFSNFFVNDPNSAIQWPFAVGVPISYGFGMRSGTMHEGADFTPGEGSPIQAIADGVVRESTDSGGAYGVSIIIDHIIDGELVSSHYAHMQYGSRQVEVGDTVTVGTVIGHTGNTGRSYGAHTHFEILANGTTAIDPIPWLRQHAGG